MGRRKSCIGRRTLNRTPNISSDTESRLNLERRSSSSLWERATHPGTPGISGKTGHYSRYSSSAAPCLCANRHFPITLHRIRGTDIFRIWGTDIFRKHFTEYGAIIFSDHTISEHGAPTFSVHTIPTDIFRSHFTGYKAYRLRTQKNSVTFPGKSGWRPSSSAKMHPTLQRSTAYPYSPSGQSISSGGRYHRVTTCSVIGLCTCRDFQKPESRERELTKSDENRRAEGTLNPARDKNKTSHIN